MLLVKSRGYLVTCEFFPAFNSNYNRNRIFTSFSVIVLETTASYLCIIIIQLALTYCPIFLFAFCVKDTDNTFTYIRVYYTHWGNWYTWLSYQLRIGNWDRKNTGINNTIEKLCGEKPTVKTETEFIEVRLNMKRIKPMVCA